MSDTLLKEGAIQITHEELKKLQEFDRKMWEFLDAYHEEQARQERKRKKQDAVLLLVAVTAFVLAIALEVAAVILGQLTLCA